MRIYHKMKDHFGPLHWWPGETPFEIMIGAILTQNTSWSNAEKAIRNLKTESLLTPQKLDHISKSRLETLLKPSGFFRVKARRVKEFLRHLRQSYQYEIRRMKAQSTSFLREELLEINGIGKETADSILLYALSKKVFVIDAYTRRIYSRHGFWNQKLEYDAIRNWFEEALPKRTGLWNDYHAQLVMVGKHYCKSKPKCNECPLNFLFKVEGLKKQL